MTSKPLLPIHNVADTDVEDEHTVYVFKKMVLLADAQESIKVAFIAGVQAQVNGGFNKTVEEMFDEWWKVQ